MSVIKYIDIFGSTINFQYKSKQKFSTTFGGILSILYFFLVAGCFYLIGRDFFSRKKSFITSSNEYTSSIIFSKEDFAINLADENYEVFNNERIVYFQLWENIVINDELISNSYQLVNCNQTQFNKHIGGLTNSSNYFCLPKDLILSNYINKEDNNNRVQRFFEIQVIKCHENGINNFTKEECLPDSEADSLVTLSNLAATFYYPKVNIDVTKYKNEEAILSTLYENFFYLRSNTGKFVELYFTSFQVDSDYGWIFESVKSIQKIGNTNYNYDNIPKIELGSEYKNNLGVIYIYFDGQLQKQLREYYKIQNLFSDIGGLLEVFTVIFSFMANTYSSLLIKLELFNSYFIDEKAISKNNNFDFNNNTAKVEEVKDIKTKTNDIQPIYNQSKHTSKYDITSNMDLFIREESNNLRKVQKFNSDGKIISVIKENSDINSKDSFKINNIIKESTKQLKDLKEYKDLNNLYKKMSVLDINADLNLKNAKNIGFFEPIKMYFISELPLSSFICNSCQSRTIYDKINLEYNTYVDINRYIKMRELFEKPSN